MVNGHGQGKAQVGQNGKKKELFFLVPLSSPLRILIQLLFSALVGPSSAAAVPRVAELNTSTPKLNESTSKLNRRTVRLNKSTAELNLSTSSSKSTRASQGNKFDQSEAQKTERERFAQIFQYFYFYLSLVFTLTLKENIIPKGLKILHTFRISLALKTSWQCHLRSLNVSFSFHSIASAGLQ